MNETDFKLLNQKIQPIFEKRPIFTFDSYSAIIPQMNKYDLYFVNLISACSEIFNLSSLKINNMHDFIKEAIPIIYYLISWVENHLERSTIFYGLKIILLILKLSFIFMKIFQKKNISLDQMVLLILILTLKI